VVVIVTDEDVSACDLDVMRALELSPPAATASEALHQISISSKHVHAVVADVTDDDAPVACHGNTRRLANTRQMARLLHWQSVRRHLASQQ
jgi:hypothetical protein